MRGRGRTPFQRGFPLPLKQARPHHRETAKRGKTTEQPKCSVYHNKSFRKGEGEFEGRGRTPFQRGFPLPLKKTRSLTGRRQAEGKRRGNRMRYRTDKARWGGRGRGTPGGGKKKVLAGNSETLQLPGVNRPSASDFYIGERPEYVQAGEKGVRKKKGNGHAAR